ncbi:putative Fe-S oxidoreductase [Candidatus Zixiibacteriota bacterium]|nr:putative Fe-S oxidoreductase [candidate division Zixibacteria bacterium]
MLNLAKSFPVETKKWTDNMTSEPLKLKQHIIYGPVNSRRLGSSLGVNILPIRYKACPFNCRYCQYGFTGAKGHVVDIDRNEFPSPPEILLALDKAYEDYPSVAYITFSGNGEPTLHPEFPHIVEKVKEWKNSHNPEIKLAILSNSALVYKEGVRRGLTLLDERFMKLDAGDESTFLRFNRPHSDIKFDMIIEGLKGLDDIVIQALFAGGDDGNSGDYAVDRWIDMIGEIRPKECHIYSLDRPSADRTLAKVDIEGLTKIKQKTERRAEVRVRVF